MIGEDSDAARQAPARRDVLVTSAIAAGLVWSAPSIRSMRISRLIGSPDPASTTSGTPTGTVIDGSIAGAGLTEFTTTPCYSESAYTLSGDLTTLGPSTVELTYCVVFDDTAPISVAFVVVNGSFTITAPDGTLSGSIPGRHLDLDLPAFTFRLDLAIESGTSAYAGAQGDVHARIRLTQSFMQASGKISGAFTI